MKKIKEINNIPEWMILDSFRYALGRRTYQVDITADWLVENWKFIPENIKILIQRELEDAFERDDRDRSAGHKDFLALGHDCDRKSWENVSNCYKLFDIVKVEVKEHPTRKLNGKWSYSCGDDDDGDYDAQDYLKHTIVKNKGTFKKPKDYKTDAEILKDIQIDILKDDKGEPIYDYIHWNNIPDEEKKEFGKWMNGQTTGVTPDGQSAIYICDYLRWKRGLPCID